MIKGVHMFQSMTAYASRTGALGQVSWMWEMRGVNARGLDLRLRLPDQVPDLEPVLRTALRKAVTRGNITCSLRLELGSGEAGLALDAAQLDRVLEALDAIQERAFDKGVTLGQPTAADVLNHRGVVQSGDRPTGASDDLTAALITDIGPLLADFTAMRATEGEALRKVIAGHLDRMTAMIGQATEQAEARRPEARKSLSESLRRVMTEMSEIDPDRVAQELALIAAKQDVTEEIDRLRAHVAAAWEMIEADKPAGRKLDFLAQEFNREANTLCAKSQSSALTATGLEIKLVIDQMREQIQNVE